MFGIRYLKTGPTQYVQLFKNGKIDREGVGLSGFYFGPQTTIVRVPTGTTDEPFAFEDVTADFQLVALQGQLTYRVADPRRLAALMDYSITPFGNYQSDDPQKLSERLVSAVRVLCADRVHAISLRQLLQAQQPIGQAVLVDLRASPAVTMLGVEILDLAIVAIKPNPETSKALEAESREGLLRQADEAIYSRRNAAVEQERRIRESELATELAVEEKRQQIETRKLEARIEAEQRRMELVATQAENDRKQADAQAYALEALLAPLRSTDYRTILAANAGSIDAKTGLTLAFRELAENAGKIGQLTISPDLLAELARDGNASPARLRRDTPDR